MQVQLLSRNNMELTVKGGDTYRNNFLTVEQPGQRLRISDAERGNFRTTRSNSVARTLFINDSNRQFLEVHKEAPRRNSMPVLIDSLRNSNILDNDDDVERVRSFRMTKKGIENKGDTFRRKSVVSLTSVGSGRSYCSSQELENPCGDCGRKSSSNESFIDELDIPESFRVVILGADGVGKKTLKTQFMTSEAICTNNISIDDTDGETKVFIQLDGEESVLKFCDAIDYADLRDMANVDVYLVVFSVDSMNTFKDATKKIQFIRQEMKTDQPIILVANKTDLARKRIVFEKDARRVAEKFNCKSVEVSVVLNHRVDELLVGVLRQVRLRRNSAAEDERTDKPNRNPSKISKVTKTFLNKFLNISTKKDVHCDDLYYT